MDTSTQVIVYRERFSALLGGMKDQLLVVSVISPCQQGKSTLISHLTGDKTISVGNGTCECTGGVYICGPYSMNAIKKRWGMPELDGDSTKVVLVYTEGLGHGDEVLEVVNKLVSPYLVISHLILIKHRCNLYSNDATSLRSCFNALEKIVSGANDGCRRSGNMIVVDVFTCVGRYETE